MSECAVGERDRLLPCLPTSLSVAGNGSPSRLFGLPGDGHYRWHSTAVCATISTLQGSSFCAEEHFFPKGCACVAGLNACREGDVKDRSPGRFSNLLFIREVLDT